MATISNTPRPGYVWDSTDNVWYPIGTGPHTHADYITSGSAINPNIVDAKGDIIAATAADTVARLAVGSNDQVLTADSSTATGLKWGTVAAGANWSLLNSGGTALTGAATVTVSGISGKDKIMILIENASSVNSSASISVRLNTDTGNNYTVHGIRNSISSSYSNNNFYKISQTSSSIPIGEMGSDGGNQVSGFCLISGCNAAGVKVLNAAGSGDQYADGQDQYIIGGFYNSSSTISSISIFSNSGNLDSGTVYVYTSA